MFTVPLIALTGGGPVTPSLGARTPFVQNNLSNVNTATISHSSATGNVLIGGMARQNAATGPGVTCLWGATGAQASVPQLEKISIPAANHLVVWINFIRGGFVGLGDATVNFTQGCRDIIFWVQDIANVPPVHIGNTFADTISSSLITVEGTITRSNANSLLVAVAGFDDGSCDPLSLSAGWTEADEQQTGTLALDIAAILASRTAGGVGDETLTVTAQQAEVERCICMVELLPV